MSPQTFELPDRFRQASIEGFDTSVSPSAASMVEAAWRFLSEPIGSMVMLGRPGAGKSHIAAAIVNAIRARNEERYRQAVDEAEQAPVEERRHPGPPPEPWWVPVSETMVRVRTFRRDTEGLWLDVGSHPGLVVLDDIGRERISDWSGEQLYVAVNMRYEAQRRTIATSNLTAEALAEAGYGPLLSRLVEDGLVLNLTSAIDYRVKLRRGRMAPTGGGTSAGAGSDRSGEEQAR